MAHGKLLTQDRDHFTWSLQVRLAELGIIIIIIINYAQNICVWILFDRCKLGKGR